MARICFFLLIFFLCGAGNLHAISDSKTLPLTFNVEPATVLKTVSSNGPNAVEIGPVAQGIDATTETLQVLVLTNTEDRYRINHELRGEVTNNSGAEFPGNSLRLMVSSGEKGGSSLVPAFTPVPRGKVPIFTSRTSGGPDSFSISYSVSGKKTFEAGSYYGNIYLDFEKA